MIPQNIYIVLGPRKMAIGNKKTIDIVYTNERLHFGANFKSDFQL